jgi:hypothetical protein
MLQFFKVREAILNVKDIVPASPFISELVSVIWISLRVKGEVMWNPFDPIQNEIGLLNPQLFLSYGILYIQVH